MIKWFAIIGIGIVILGLAFAVLGGPSVEESGARGVGPGALEVAEEQVESGEELRLEQEPGGVASPSVVLPAALLLERAVVPSLERRDSAPEALGRVQVLVTDPNRAVGTRGWYKVQLTATVNGSPFQRELWTEEGSTSKVVSVPLGATISAQVIGPGKASTEAATGTLGESPTAEPTRIDLVLTGAVGAHGAGRLVDEEGAPLVRTSFSLRQLRDLGNGGSSSSRRSYETDDLGYFEAELASMLAVAGPDDLSRFEFAITTPGAPASFNDSKRFQGPLPKPLYLGDVVMVESSPLAEGRVIDGRGNPVQGATVFVSFLAEGRLLPASGGRPWIPRIGLQDCAPSGEDGSFVVTGSTTERDLFLEASADGYSFRDKVSIGAGTKSIDLVLWEAGAITGAILMPPVHNVTAWYIEIQPSGGPGLGGFSATASGNSYGSNASWWFSTLRPDGSFSWSDLKPGRYDLRFRNEFEAEPVAVWNGIEVRPGEVSEPPKLQDCDLVKLVGWAAFRVVDEKGKAIRRASYSRIDGESSRSWIPCGKGLFLGAPVVTLAIAATGRLTEIVDVVPGSVEVQLNPAPRITFELPNGLQIPEGATLAVSLIPTQRDGRQLSGFFSKSELREGRVEIVPSAYGPCSLKLEFKPKGSNRWRAMSLPSDRDRLEVVAGSDGQRVELPVTQEMLEAILEQ